MRMIQPASYFLIFFFLTTNCAHTSANHIVASCDQDSKLQGQKTAELLQLAQEDQIDRSGPLESINWNQVSQRDLERRQKVAKIFAEGSFKVASDYSSAATVFQHGTTADHFYQAFLWANKALLLGDDSRRWWTAAALDRYLVKTGHKQLFGTQLSKNSHEKWCLQPVELSFPNSLRIKYVKFNVQDQIKQTLKGIGSNQSPSDVKDCEPALKDSPKGTVPGFW